MPNVIDLFSGAGGLSLGAARAGFNVSAAVEIEPHAMASHQTNFPHTVHVQQDIMTLNPQTLLDLAAIDQNDLTGIIGGPPCQGFSDMGRGDVDDIRNKLFVRFFEFVEALQPAFFLAENVPGIMKEKYLIIRGEAFRHVQNYHILPPICINASEYGAPTTRTRYFFIGYRNDGPIEELIAEDFEQMKVPEDQRTTVRKALEGLPSDIRYRGQTHSDIRQLLPSYYDVGQKHAQSEFFYQRVTGIIPEGIGNTKYINRYTTKHQVNGCIPTLHTQEVRLRYMKLNYGERDAISKATRLAPNGYCPTLRAGTGPEKGSYQAVRPIHYDRPRVITPREAARLQGFPDWYKLPETIWHGFRQIGNSVSPIVAERVLSAIYQKLT